MIDLHISPRGEAKWVRGPSGLGSSRAEEKGASRLACATGSVRFFTNHETRDTNHGFLPCALLFLAASVLLNPAVAWPQESGADRASGLPPAAAVQVDFSRDIAPVFQANCVACHGPAQQMNGLRLDSPERALQGGYSGPVIKPGDSAASKLVLLVVGVPAPGHKEGLVMPPAGERLSAGQVGLLRAWIDQGARWAEAPELAVAEAQERSPANSSHWAFIPPSRPELPDVQQSDWVRNPIDAFILRRLEAEGIQPSPEADRNTLVRRLSFDLTGLPPTPGEVAAFLADERPEAYEELVERLLDSPHYGEKWARHWLDLARYADSDGYETDQLRPNAWRYRHWLVETLNRDMPFNQFTIEQIAGDLLPGATLRQRVATGFQRNTLSNREGGADLEEFRTEQVVDRAATLGTVWLGLTVGCARCHDHKYDPVSQQEFYQLYAFFNSADELNIDAPLPGEMGPYLSTRAEYESKRRELLAPLETEIAELQAAWEKRLLETEANPGRDHLWDRAWEVLGLVWGGGLGEGQLEGQRIVNLDPSRRTKDQAGRLRDYFIKYGSIIDKERYEELKLKELSGKLAELAKSYPKLTRAPTLVENPRGRRTYIHLRGNFRNHGIEVEPGAPAVLHPLRADPKPNRLTLARWIVADGNPLTARVTVNRAWQELFGRGIVFTSDDFGRQGEKPSHPELLDWLATEFVRQGWSLKKLHKLIVMSAAYRQSSKARPALAARDPGNVLLARQSRVRLPAEAVRDASLAVSGLLNTAVGGPAVRPPQPESVIMESFEVPWEVDEGPDRYRRGLYTFIQRTAPFAQSVTFDLPDPGQTCSRRDRSNTPLQSLTLLNDPVFFEAAQALAARVLTEQQGGLSERIDYAFRLCLAREPDSAERDRLAAYLRQQSGILDREPDNPEAMLPLEVEGVDRNQGAAWVALSSVLLNLDEFITRE